MCDKIQVGNAGSVVTYQNNIVRSLEISEKLQEGRKKDRM